MPLKELSLKDKIVFDKFLSSHSRMHSAYHFANIFIWRRLFTILWDIIQDNLCVFFKDNLGTFMYLPPLGATISPGLIKKVFEIMDGFNEYSCVSRIENADYKQLCFYRSLGYCIKEKFPDYVYRRQDIAFLKGNAFKSKRASYNYFVKHYKFQFRRYDNSYKDVCLALYQDWSRQRRRGFRDSVYQKMLQDYLIAQVEALDNFAALDLEGRVVVIDGKIRAYTLGYKLNEDTFCILLEIGNFSFKGISQFIFRQFVQDLPPFKYINTMDDSGLQNLRKVKLSYRPCVMIPSYIISRRLD
jgi:hypothetical protein